MQPKKYTGKNLDHVAFPLGGIGAGMFAVEGAGAFSNFSLHNTPNVNFEPCVFSALTVKGAVNASRVLEGPVPKHKLFGGGGGKANGLGGTSYGLARFTDAAFSSRFPFAEIELSDGSVPLSVSITAWSPFAPGNADDSSLPAAFIEYTFNNRTDETVEAVYYFYAVNFIAAGETGSRVVKTDGGFVLEQLPSAGEPWDAGQFCAFTDEAGAKINAGLFRGGWFDTLTMAWNDISAAKTVERAHSDDGGGPSPGGLLSVPFAVGPGGSKTITLNCCWHVSETNLNFGGVSEPGCGCGCECRGAARSEKYHRPWYTNLFSDITDTVVFIKKERARLREMSALFRDTFYSQTLDPIVMEAIGANLSILKSPTVLRQTDGRLWCWEGCCDEAGCCAGSCTHVWNYAQAVCHLFPELERGMRRTEFYDCQDGNGHQTFRAPLPIRAASHDFHAAADGQLGGIIKTYRDFKICGDINWLRSIWDRIKCSIDYCIKTWDVNREGVLTEPHHNTYDIEFWGPDGMCSSIYLGALKAMAAICEILGEDGGEYAALYKKGRAYLETKLFNGEYFIQDVRWENIEAKLPGVGDEPLNDKISPEAYALTQTDGPKYQYGSGCLSDGVLGAWFSECAGLGGVLDAAKVESHLMSVYKYNFKTDFTSHSNPQRPGYCCGDEAGLLLCSWPRGGKPALPFVYSDEVWTGIEYQVASHLIMSGHAAEGLEIVKACRARYDGSNRNPYNEYECGSWYARALASYSLIQALTGMRYDAHEKRLYINPRVKGDFTAFLAADSGYGTAGVKDGAPFIEVVSGFIEAVEFFLYGKPFA